jgi:3-dehydroquinate synthase
MTKEYSKFPILKVKVCPGSKVYWVYIGSKAHQQIQPIVQRMKKISALVLITNSRIQKLHGVQVINELKGIGVKLEIITIPEGETSKSLKEAERVLNLLIEKDIDRHALIIGFGGGVIGDFSGFIAATYQRGLKFGLIPTTLLSAVDASVGGKVAVNLEKGKNMVGAFHQPSFVLQDLDFLKTLSQRDYLSGVAEVIKHALIGDPVLLKNLLAEPTLVKSRNEKMLEIMVARSVRYKNSIVSRDEREKGLRQVLNFGHTVGHAIESFKNYQGITHGEAVSIGMVSALLLSNRIFKFPLPEIERVINLLRQLGLPLWAEDVPAEGIIEHLKYDKKRHKSETFFVLLKKPTQPKFGIPVPGKILEEVLQFQKHKL